MEGVETPHPGGFGEARGKGTGAGVELDAVGATKIAVEVPPCRREGTPSQRPCEVSAHLDERVPSGRPLRVGEQDGLAGLAPGLGEIPLQVRTRVEVQAHLPRSSARRLRTLRRPFGRRLIGTGGVSLSRVTHPSARPSASAGRPETGARTAVGLPRCVTRITSPRPARATYSES